VNLNIPAPKIWDLQMGPKPQHGNFLENSCNDFNKIVVNYEDYIPK
jgi:hypothetical protein